MSPEGYLKPSKLGGSLRPHLLLYGLIATDTFTDCEDVLPVLAGTELVRDVSCPGLHPTVDILVVARGPPDWVGALERVQGESCPGLHPTVDRLAGWPKALQTGLEPTPVFDEA